MQLGRRHNWAGTLSLIFLAVFMIEQAAGAEVYQWVDENGAVWFADSLDKVPPEYRAWAYHKRKNVQEGPSISTPIDPKSETVPAPEPSKNPQDPPVTWQERLTKARAELDKLKAKREKIATELNTYTADYYTRLFRGREDGSKQSAMLAELDDLIAQKEYEINTILDEARKAGVPSGALSQ